MDTSNDKVRIVLEGLRVPADSMTKEEWWEILTVVTKKIKPRIKHFLGAKEICELMLCPDKNGVVRTNTSITNYDTRTYPTTRAFFLFSCFIQPEGQKREIFHLLLDYDGHLLAWEELYDTFIKADVHVLESSRVYRLTMDNFESRCLSAKKSLGLLSDEILRGILELLKGTIEKKEEHLNALRTARNELAEIFRRVKS